jgi:hypothetical protein
MARKLVLSITASLLIATLAGCNMGANATTQAPSATETQPPVVDVTATPLPATSAPAGVPTQAPPAGATSAPQTNPTQAPPPAGGGSATRVTFSAGATHANVPGSVAAHGKASYIVNVAAGQLLDVSANGPAAQQPQIAVVGADGKTPQNVLNNAVSFRGAVPTTQDYTVTLTGVDQPLNFTLAIVIPERISFAKGGDETIVGGKVAASDVHQYVLNLRQSQLFELALGQQGIHTQIYGVDGNVLQSGMGGGAGFRGTVPSTQDYIVNVVSDGGAVDYAMTVKVPERITFAPDATSVTLQGSVEGHSYFAYVINLQAGQVLDVSSDLPDTSMGLSIYGVGGNVIKSGASGASFRGKVPMTQDYIIDLLGGPQTASYNLNVVVAQRITFAVGGTSATLTGAIKAHESHFYVVGGAAGQTLSVTFTPAGGAKMSIYGLDGNVLWSGMGEGTQFTGKLPTAQDYYIVFQAGDGPVAQFQLVVTIK